MSNENSRFQPVSNATTTRVVEDKETPATGKLLIGSLDDSSLTVQAMFNPKELEVTRSVPWSKTNEANKGNRKGGGAATGDRQGIHMEFTGAEGRSLSLELLFDGYELAAKGRGVNVAKEVEKLQKMADVRVPGSKSEAEKRPHHCLVVWGDVLPRFECVIESLSIKYTMFDKDGTPLRATCNVKVREANIVSAKKSK